MTSSPAGARVVGIVVVAGVVGEFCFLLGWRAASDSFVADLAKGSHLGLDGVDGIVW